MNKFYMDDFLNSFKTTDEAIEQTTCSKETLKFEIQFNEIFQQQFEFSFNWQHRRRYNIVATSSETDVGWHPHFLKTLNKTSKAIEYNIDNSCQ